LFFEKERVNLSKIWTMKNINLMENAKFQFTKGAEVAILSLDDKDANKLLRLLKKAADDLLSPNGSPTTIKGTINGLYWFHYEYCLIIFKVNYKNIEIMHIVNNKRFKSPEEAIHYNYETV
jgi:hypothetical protein